VISPIGSITSNGHETIYNDFNVGKVTLELYNHLTRIQLCEEEDRYGWVIDVTPAGQA
jgi:hypothetical protein